MFEDENSLYLSCLRSVRERRGYRAKMILLCVGRVGKDEGL